MSIAIIVTNMLSAIINIIIPVNNILIKAAILGFFFNLFSQDPNNAIAKGPNTNIIAIKRLNFKKHSIKIINNIIAKVILSLSLNFI